MPSCMRGDNLSDVVVVAVVGGELCVRGGYMSGIVLDVVGAVVGDVVVYDAELHER
jgi:hypothetical protein